MPIFANNVGFLFDHYSVEILLVSRFLHLPVGRSINLEGINTPYCLRTCPQLGRGVNPLSATKISVKKEQNVLKCIHEYVFWKDFVLNPLICIYVEEYVCFFR